MSKQEKLFRQYEKLVKAEKRSGADPDEKPCSCKRCRYYRPDFKYRRCQFSRCQFGQENDVFRKLPLKRDKFSGKEVSNMHV